jgi:predicted GNAT family N-acyltransferase
VKECLHLRFRIYEALGYLDEELSQDAEKLDVDCFDTHALHLCAVDLRSGDVVGTLRIVLPTDPCQFADSAATVQGKLDFGRVRRLTQVVAAQAAWIREKAEPDDLLRRRLHAYNHLAYLPILFNSDFGRRWPNFLEDYPREETAEISRVVVAPRYRGMGISRLLMRAAIAAASELNLRHLLLECIPQHIAMYGDYGFTDLYSGHHCRVRDLDQYAIGMKLNLKLTPGESEAISTNNRVHQWLSRGRERNEVVLGKQGLCLCRISECWRKAQYGYFGQCICPLARRMVDL